MKRLKWGATPFQKRFPRDTILPIRAALQGSVPPFGSAVVQSRHVHSVRAHSHLTWQPGPMSPALNPSPPSHATQKVAAPSLIIKRTSLTVIRALPPPPRSDIAPQSPKIRIIPCTPKTSKPRTKSLSDESHCGPGRMFSAAAWRSWRYAESNRRHIAARSGRYDVHFYTGADGNSGRKRLTVKSSSELLCFPR